mmetsp:Transcript_89902/g.290417  ORF Transcript_89902/g.290417 Transcript_89902/m.290417 type:complete len:269 (-) Transcript_89902:77-883(-)
MDDAEAQSQAGPLNAEFQQESSSARKLDTPWEFWEGEVTELRRWLCVLPLFYICTVLVRLSERRAWLITSTWRDSPEQAIKNHLAIVDVLDVLGQWHSFNVVEFLTYALMVYYLLSLCWKPTRLLCVRQSVVQFGVGLLFRAGGLFLTVYPDAEGLCFERTVQRSYPLWRAIIPVFVPIPTCGDMMPSGHTLLYCAICYPLAWHSSSVEGILVVLGGFVGMVFLCVQRIHWTDDVYVSLTVGTLVWLMSVRVRREDSVAGKVLRILCD